MRVAKRAGSTFKRLVLVDEAVFELLKKGAAATPGESARTYIQDQTSGYLEKANAHDSDKLAIYDALRRQREQLDKAAAEIARKSRKRKTADVAFLTAPDSTIPHDVAPGSPHDVRIDIGESDTSSDDEFEDAEGQNLPETSAGKSGMRQRTTPAKLPDQSVASTEYASPFLRTGPARLPDVEVPGQYQNKNARLKIMLEDSQRFRVDNTEQVIIDGKTVVGSNYPKIVRSFFVKSGSGEEQNVGRTRMLVKMVDAGIDRDAISTSGAKSIMMKYQAAKDKVSPPKAKHGRDAKQAGNGRPPGRKPRLLYVYRS